LVVFQAGETVNPSMVSTFLQNMADVREQGLDEDAIRAVAGITHLGGADTVRMIGCPLRPPRF